MADIENSDEAVNPLGTAAGGDGGGNEPPATGGGSGLSEYDGPTIDISEEMRQSYLVRDARAWFIPELPSPEVGQGCW